MISVILLMSVVLYCSRLCNIYRLIVIQASYYSYQWLSLSQVIDGSVTSLVYRRVVINMVYENSHWP